MKKWENPKIEALGINKTEASHNWNTGFDGQWCEDATCPNHNSHLGGHPNWKS